MATAQPQSASYRRIFLARLYAGLFICETYLLAELARLGACIPSDDDALPELRLHMAELRFALLTGSSWGRYLGIHTPQRGGVNQDWERLGIEDVLAILAATAAITIDLRVPTTVRIYPGYWTEGAFDLATAVEIAGMPTLPVKEAKYLQALVSNSNYRGLFNDHDPTADSKGRNKAQDRLTVWLQEVTIVAGLENLVTVECVPGGRGPSPLRPRIDVNPMTRISFVASDPVNSPAT